MILRLLVDQTMDYNKSQKLRKWLAQISKASTLLGESRLRDDDKHRVTLEKSLSDCALLAGIQKILFARCESTGTFSTFPLQ